MFRFQKFENVGRSADLTNYANVLEENVNYTWVRHARGARALPTQYPYQDNLDLTFYINAVYTYSQHTKPTAKLDYFHEQITLLQ